MANLSEIKYMKFEAENPVLSKCTYLQPKQPRT